MKFYRYFDVVECLCFGLCSRLVGVCISSCVMFVYVCVIERANLREVLHLNVRYKYGQCAETVNNHKNFERLLNIFNLRL